METKMSRDTSQGKGMLNRRTLLHAGVAASFAAPIGVFGAQALPFQAAARGLARGVAAE
jgi:hypothetical protein